MCFGGTTSGGTQNRREVFWSDIEDNTDWTPSATNQAGSQILTTNGDLLGSVIIRDQVLIFTTTDAHIAQYVGQPYVYQFNRVGENCGPVSINAVAVANNTAYWMGNAGNGFFMYDGYVRSVPSDVEDYINTEMTEAQSSKVIAWHNSLHSEIFWFYPGSDSTEISAYVSFNYE